jgi:hypothetical protein
LPSPASLIDGAREARRSCKPGVGPILAGAIGNALVDAWSDGDLARRDSLLDELRQLALAYPDDANVRAQLAEGLLSTLFKATAEKDLVRREVLLDELRALARTYPDDTTVRDQLAQGLCSRLVDAEEEGDLARCDALLDELRALSRVNPDDAGLRRELAVGLVFTLLGAAPGEDAARRVLLEELGLLASSYPDELEGWLANLRALTESSADLAAMQELFGGLKGD